jgi:hypothetical protein
MISPFGVVCRCVWSTDQSRFQLIIIVNSLFLPPSVILLIISVLSHQTSCSFRRETTITNHMIQP